VKRDASRVAAESSVKETIPMTTTQTHRPGTQARDATRQGLYQTTEQHDISRCERGLAPILGATCRCGGTLFGKQRGNGYAFFAQLPPADLHSFHFGEEEAGQ